MQFKDARLSPRPSQWIERSLFLLAALTLSACIKFDALDTAPKGPYPPTLPSELLSQTIGDCRSGTLLFLRLTSPGILLFSPGDAILSGDLQLELKTDGTYAALYREFDTTSETFQNLLTGTFSYDSNTGVVRLSNIGSGSIKLTGGRYVLTLTPDTAIHSTILTERVLEFRTLRSVDGLSVSHSDICH